MCHTMCSMYFKVITAITTIIENSIIIIITLHIFIELFSFQILQDGLFNS